MTSQQHNKNPSHDFALKKEFIDLQVELKKFVDETGLFTLHDILKDPLVVHSLDDYVNAYRELDDSKRTKKTLKRLLKYKKKNINLQPFLQELELSLQNAEDCENYSVFIYNTKEDLVSFKEKFDFKNSLFTVKSPRIQKELTKDRMLQIFKGSVSKMDNLKKIQILKPVVNRNFTVSSSHSHLLKKIEKNNDVRNGDSKINEKVVNEKSANENPGVDKQVGEKFGEVMHKSPLQKLGNAITSTASFRNGVLKSSNISEKGIISMPFGQSNIVKATRSPRQSTIIGSEITPGLTEAEIPGRKETQHSVFQSNQISVPRSNPPSNSNISAPRANISVKSFIPRSPKKQKEDENSN